MNNEACRKAFLLDWARKYPNQEPQGELYHQVQHIAWLSFQAAYNLRPKLSVEEIRNIVEQIEGIRSYQAEWAAIKIYNAQEAKE